MEPLETRELLDGSSLVLDASFGNSGRTKFDVYGFGDRVSAVFAAPGGKTLVGISATSHIDTTGGSTVASSSGVIARLNEDGTLDTSFGEGGTAGSFLGPPIDGDVTRRPATSVDGINFITVQPDGKILVGAHFGTATWPADPAPASTPAPSPRVVSGGFAVLRLNADGTLDADFGANGLAVAQPPGSPAGRPEVRGLAVQADGKIVAVGRPARPIGAADWDVVRFNPDGSVDDSFHQQVGDLSPGSVAKPAFVTAQSVVVDSEDRVVVGGYRGGNDGTMPAGDFVLARYNADGTRDSTFGAGGVVQTPFPAVDDPMLPGGKSRAAGVTELALQPDGKIVALGSLASTNVALARYNPDGTLDASFSDDGVVYARAADNGRYAMRLGADGTISVAGVGEAYEWRRTETNGSISMEMVRSLGTQVFATTLDASGKVTGQSLWLGTPPTGDEDLFAVEVRADGAIITGGVAYPTKDAGEGLAYTETGDALVAKFNSPGFGDSNAAPSSQALSFVTIGTPGAAPLPRGNALWLNYVTSVSASPVTYDLADPGLGSGSSGGTSVTNGAGGGSLIRFNGGDFADRVVATPIAATLAGRETVTGGRAYAFRITFGTEALAKSTSVTVTGPGGFTAAANPLKLKRVRARTSGGTGSGAAAPPAAAVSYRVPAPGGKFDAADDGAYGVWLNYTAANGLLSGQVAGVFHVNAPQRRGAVPTPSDLGKIATYTGLLRNVGSAAGSATGWLLYRSDSASADLVELDLGQFPGEAAALANRRVTVTGSLQTQSRPGRGTVVVFVVSSIARAT